MRKYNVLVTTPYSLFPANSGGRIHVLSTLKPVADRVNLHLLAFLNQSEWEFYLANRAAINEKYYHLFQSIHFFPRPPLPHEMPGKTRKLIHFLTHSYYGLPLMDVSYYDASYIQLARQLIERYNIELLETHQLHMAFIKKFFPKTPTILVEQNREHELWPFWPHSGKRIGDRLWNQFGKLSRKISYQVEVENTWKIEGRCFISLEEMKQANLVAGKLFWLPPAVECEEREKIFNKEKLKVLWVGGFDWFPNKEGATWFAQHCWPLLKAQAGSMEFHFIGSNPPPELLGLHDGVNVFVHGFMADIEEFWQSSDIFIVPLQSGGGIRIKIVEALNAGIPVVTTRKGCEGVPYEHGIDLLIANEPDRFVESILKLRDTRLRQFLSENGRKLIRKYFSLSEMGNRKMAIYDAVIRR